MKKTTMNNPACKHSRCNAYCCRQHGHEYAVLLDKKEMGKFHPTETSWFQEIFIPYVNGKCPYLKDSLCSTHSDKPKKCRNFLCTKSRRYMKDNPELEKLLTEKQESRAIQRKCPERSTCK